jgi:hypothetical protein
MCGNCNIKAGLDFDSNGSGYINTTPVPIPKRIYKPLDTALISTPNTNANQSSNNTHNPSKSNQHVAFILSLLLMKSSSP